MRNIINALGIAGYLLVILLAVAVPVAYVVNAVKLVNCDFQTPYRCEAVHAVGLVPLVSLITAFEPSDK